VTTESESGESVPEDMDVRKPSARIRRAGASQSRKGIVAVAELLGGFSNASAEAFRSLNSALTPESVTRNGLRASIFVGIREGNVRFLEELSQTSRRVFDTVRPPRPGEEIDSGTAAEIQGQQARRRPTPLDEEAT
jgi:hypothetical protein